VLASPAVLESLHLGYMAQLSLRLLTGELAHLLNKWPMGGSGGITGGVGIGFDKLGFFGGALHHMTRCREL